MGRCTAPRTPCPRQVGSVTKENSTKAIVTSTGTVIKFLDNVKTAVYIKTLGKNTIVLDDEALFDSLTGLIKGDTAPTKAPTP